MGGSGGGGRGGVGSGDAVAAGGGDHRTCLSVAPAIAPTHTIVYTSSPR